MTTAKRGRPTDYTSELAVEICQAIACSSQGLRKLCQQHEHWPCPDTVYSWLMKHTEFSEQYAIAKQVQVEVLVDEILEIADDVTKDTIVNDKGKAVCNSEWINRSRLRVDSRKWIASKLVPKVYGERLSNTYSVPENTLRTLEALEKTRRDQEDIF